MRKVSGYRLADLVWLISQSKSSDTFVRELALELTYEFAYLLGKLTKTLDELAGVTGHMPVPVREQVMAIIEDMAAAIGRMSESLEVGE